MWCLISAGIRVPITRAITPRWKRCSPPWKKNAGRSSRDATLCSGPYWLGGSVLFNWLGRAGRNAAPLISAAAAVSAPLDLVASGLAIDRGLNRVYSYALLSTLRPKSFAMEERFPGQLDLERLRCARTMYEFDKGVTAPLPGFSGTHDYWSRASSRPWLRQIGIPTLACQCAQRSAHPRGWPLGGD